MTARGFDVFVSYSSQNKLEADAVCAKLESAGIRCWIAPRDVLPGTEWGDAIIGGIEHSRIMVLIFSDHANASPQVRREVERAINRGLTLIPFRVENVLPTRAMEYCLSNTHWMDAFDPPFEKHIERLLDVVQNLMDESGQIVGPRKSATRGAEINQSPPDRRAPSPLVSRLAPGASRNHRIPMLIGACAILLVVLIAVLVHHGESPATTQSLISHPASRTASDPTGLVSQVRRPAGERVAPSAVDSDIKRRPIRVEFTEPEGMSIGWATENGFAENQLTSPGIVEFQMGQTYRLILQNIPSRGRMVVYPTLELYPADKAMEDYLVRYRAAPLEITDEDLDDIQRAKMLTKVLYFPTGDPGVLGTGRSAGMAGDGDPVAEAEQHGTVIFVLRVSNFNLETDAAPPPPADAPAPKPPP